MTEIEMMERARVYLEKLANGTDPLTGEAVSEDDVVNNVKVSRCLFYASDILRQVISNGSVEAPVRRKVKQEFSLTKEELQAYEFSETPVTVTEITRRLNSLITDMEMANLKLTSITAFLMNCGLLKQIELDDGKTRKVPTQAGEETGISDVERRGRYGFYHVTIYNQEAQQYIIDHIDAIAKINAK